MLISPTVSWIYCYIPQQRYAYESPPLSIHALRDPMIYSEPPRIVRLGMVLAFLL
jgi:hypothetical protein